MVSNNKKNRTSSVSSNHSSSSSSTSSSTNNTSTLPHNQKLTHDQESFLKQQLLKYSIQDELVIYFNDADNLAETLFTKFLFEQLTTIPLLTSKVQAKLKFQQLIHTLPAIVIQSQLASKQETRDHFRKFVVKVFDVALRTPQEKKKDKTLKIFKDPTYEESKRHISANRRSDILHQQTTEDREEAKEEEEKEKKKSAKDIERDETILKLQKRLTEITQVIIMNIENKNSEAEKLKQKNNQQNNNQQNNNQNQEQPNQSTENGISHLFNIILNTKHFRDLPAEFYEFTTTLIKILALWMERELRDPKQIVKLKRLYMITPVKAIRASLALANPITLLKGIILLFLAKPFGARNLIQTIASVMVEVSKTERATKKSLKDLETALGNIPNRQHRKLLINKMKGWVANTTQVVDVDGQPISYFKEVPDAITIMQYQWPGSPSLDPEIISQLSDQHFTALFEYVKLEKRRKEKNDFVDILGNDEMIEIIRELLPVLYEPLGKLFCKANIGYHFEKIAYCMKKILTVAETGELEEDDDTDLELSETMSDMDNSQSESTHSSPGIYSSRSPIHTPRQVTESEPNSPLPEKKKSSNIFSWLKPSNLFSSSSSNEKQPPNVDVVINEPLYPNTSTTTTTTTQQQQQQNSRDLKKKFKKDKNATISMAERLALFEDVSYILMERIYDMIHDLVVSDAKNNINNNTTTTTTTTTTTEGDDKPSTGLLSQSVCWLLGLLQFLKDEEVDVYKYIYCTLSPDLQKKVLLEIDQVVEYRKWRIENGNLEATKKNIEKVDKQGLDLDKEKEKEKADGPPKPIPIYLPTLTTPFIELVRERFLRLGDPSKYSLINLSSVVVNYDDDDDQDEEESGEEDEFVDTLQQPPISFNNIYQNDGGSASDDQPFSNKKDSLHTITNNTTTNNDNDNVDGDLVSSPSSSNSGDIYYTPPIIRK